MTLTLSSTDKDLQAILEEVWKDNRVNAVENLRLRRQSDAVADKFSDSPTVVKKLMQVQMLVDLLADKLEDLSSAVYQQNIRNQEAKAKANANALRQEDVDLQTHAQRDAAAGDTTRLVAADDQAKHALMQQRNTLIRAVEYQIAYVVVAAEATVGRLQI